MIENYFPVILRLTNRIYIPFRSIRNFTLRFYKRDFAEEATKKYYKEKLNRVLVGEDKHRSRYRRMVVSTFEKVLASYFNVIEEKLLDGHEIVLPGSLGVMSIMDASPISKKYNIKLNGQDPQLRIKVLAKSTKTAIHNKRLSYYRVVMTSGFKRKVHNRILKQGYKYPKIQKYNNGKHEIHKPLSNSYITGEELQKQAVR